MKVIAFSTAKYPDSFSPMAKRMHLYLKAIKLQGAKVEVVIPSLENKDGGIYEGIPFPFVKIRHQRSVFNERKVVKEFSAIFSDLAKRCDIIFTSEDTNYSIRELTRSVHAVGGKIVIELNENPYSIKASRKDIKLLMLVNRKIFLNWTLPKVDGVITISHSLYDLVVKYKKNNASVVRIPILSGDIETRRDRIITETPYILHAGSLSEQKDGIKAMLESFLIAKKKLGGNLNFIFTSKTGFPSLLAWIDKFIEQNGLKNHVEFKGIVSNNQLNELYNNCSLAILNKPSNSQNDYNFPTKLTELLPREIPIIISNTGEIKYYFKDMVNAYIVEPNNIEQIAEKIIYIINHPEEASKIAQNGRLLAGQEFYYHNNAQKLFNFFEEIVNN